MTFTALPPVFKLFSQKIAWPTGTLWQSSMWVYASHATHAVTLP